MKITRRFHTPNPIQSVMAIRQNPVGQNLPPPPNLIGLKKGIEFSDFYDVDRNHLTLKRMGGDQIDTSHIWKLAMTFWMQLGVWNLHVIFIFGVYDEWRKKNLGVLKNFFQKFFIRNFFFRKFSFKKNFFFVIFE